MFYSESETPENFAKSCQSCSGPGSVSDTVVDAVCLICSVVTCPSHVPPSVTTPLNCDCANSLCPSTAMWQQMAHRYATLITERPDPCRARRLCCKERWSTAMCASLPWSVRGPAAEGCCVQGRHAAASGSASACVSVLSSLLSSPPSLAPLPRSSPNSPFLCLVICISLHPFKPSTPPTHLLAGDAASLT